MTEYWATKHYIAAFTAGLQIENENSNVIIQELDPGQVNQHDKRIDPYFKYWGAASWTVGNKLFENFGIYEANRRMVVSQSACVSGVLDVS